MDERVLKLETPGDFEVFAKNASERGRPDQGRRS